MLKNRWVTVKKKKYYLGADGAAKTGWYTIGAKTYYFGTTGVMNSRFTKSVSADLRKVITSVDRIAKSQKITYKTGTNTALLKLYNYMRNTCKYGREDFPAASQKGWDVTYAGENAEHKGRKLLQLCGRLCLSGETDHRPSRENCYGKHKPFPGRATGSFMPGARSRSVKPGIPSIPTQPGWQKIIPRASRTQPPKANPSTNRNAAPWSESSIKEPMASEIPPMWM